MPADFERVVRERFDISDGPASPARRGEIAMASGGKWQTLRARVPPANDANGSLDVSVLQEQLLAPVLGTRRDDRQTYRLRRRRKGTRALEQFVNTGHAVAAFSMFPVSVADLIAVADAGAIMPPKSTWFEPKLRDGLLIHLI